MEAMKKKTRLMVVISMVVISGTLLSLTGCNTQSNPINPSGQVFKRDTSRPDEDYSQPPNGVARVRVAVQPFEVDTTRVTGSNVEEYAADQLMTLAHKTRRFHVIERAELQKLLDEQGLEGIVKPEEIARVGQVRGVDWLFIGKVTNFSVKTEKTGRGVVLPGGLLPDFGGLGLKKTTTTLNINCGVDLRLVDSTGGIIIASEHGEYINEVSAGELDIEVMGGSARSEGQVMVDEDSMGKLLRFALDDALQRMLADVDEEMQKRTQAMQAAVKAGQEKTTSLSAKGATQTNKQHLSSAVAELRTAQRRAVAYCPECGKGVGTMDKFCGSCGKQLK